MSSLITHADPVPPTERLDSITLRSVDGSTEAEFVPGANMVCSSLRYLGAEYLHQLTLFPFPHELIVDATLESGALTITTTLARIGHKSVPVSFGYHPYLRVSDEARSRWHVTLGARQRLLLDGAMIPTGEREPFTQQRFTLADRNLDDGFDGLETPASFEAAAGNVAVNVQFLEGYAYAQVYAPRCGRARRQLDLGRVGAGAGATTFHEASRAGSARAGRP